MFQWESCIGFLSLFTHIFKHTSTHSSSITFSFFLYLWNTHKNGTKIHISIHLPFPRTHTHTNNYSPRPCVPFPGVRLWVVTSPVALQRAGAVPNMDFLLFPRSFPLPEPAGDSVDRPVFPHTRGRQKKVVNNAKQTDWRHRTHDVSISLNWFLKIQKSFSLKVITFCHNDELGPLPPRHHSKCICFNEHRRLELTAQYFKLWIICRTVSKKYIFTF